MSKRLLIGAGALTMAVAVTGCVWVPLLIAQLNRKNSDLSESQKAVQELGEEFETSKKQNNEVKTNLRVDLANAKIERNQFKDDLRAAQDKLAAQRLELARLEKQLGGAPGASAQAEDGSKSGDAEKSAGATPKNSVAKSNADAAATGPNKDGQQRPTEKAADNSLATRFDDDSLYDDSGWENSSSAATAKVVTEKPAVIAEPANSDTLGAGELHSEAGGITVMRREYVLPDNVVIPLYGNEMFVYPAETYYLSPLIIYP